MGRLDVIIRCCLAFLVVAFEVQIPLQWSFQACLLRYHKGSLDVIIRCCLAFLVAAFEVQIPL